MSRSPVEHEDRARHCARVVRCPGRVVVEETPRVCEPCACHNGPGTPCDVPGGCGHLHVTRTLTLGAPIERERGLCLSCEHSVVRALVELPMDYTELNILLASGESGITELVSSSSDLQVPIRLSVEALQARMVGEVQVWAEAVAERLGVDWSTDDAKHSRPGFLLQRATRLLSGALSVFLALPEVEFRPARDCDWQVRDGIGGACELLRCHELVRHAAGKVKLVHRLGVPCPECRRQSLIRLNGSDVVQCEHCPRVRYPEDQYKRMCLVLADDYRDDAPMRRHRALCSSDEGSTGSHRVPA